jgi:hypothetical protein
MKNNRSGSPSRRTATKVKDGRVQRKNGATPSSHCRLEIMRRTPEPGFRHVVNKQDILSFIELIPEWERLSERLERIVLEGGGDDCDGYYLFFHRAETGGIYLHAWPEDLWVTFTKGHYDYHPQMEVLGVAAEVHGDSVICRFTEAQARAFMLLHVFIHELGHHRQSVRSKHRSSKLDEDYAEKFANIRFWDIHPRYVGTFGDPARRRTMTCPRKRFVWEPSGASG